MTSTANVPDGWQYSKLFMHMKALGLNQLSGS